MLNDSQEILRYVLLGRSDRFMLVFVVCKRFVVVLFILHEFYVKNPIDLVSQSVWLVDIELKELERNLWSEIWSLVHTLAQVFSRNETRAFFKYGLKCRRIHLKMFLFSLKTLFNTL